MRRVCRIFAAAALGLLGPACSVTRHIPEGQYLVQRVKIEDEPSAPKHILTVWGYGYRWNA